MGKLQKTNRSQSVCVRERLTRRSKKISLTIYRIASICFVTFRVCLLAIAVIERTYSDILFNFFHFITFDETYVLHHNSDEVNSNNKRANWTHETSREKQTKRVRTSKIIIIIEWYLNAAACVSLIYPYLLHCNLEMELNRRVSVELSCVEPSFGLRENSRLQLSRTYRIVFLIRTQDKVKTIYQANVTIEFTKPDSTRIMAHLANGEQHNHAKCDDMNWNS